MFGFFKIAIPLLILSFPVWIVLFLVMMTNKKQRGYYWYTRKHFQAFWSKFSAFETMTWNRLGTTTTTKAALSYKKRWLSIDLYINEVGIFWHRSRRNKKQGWLLIFDVSQKSVYDAPHTGSLQSYKIENGVLLLIYSAVNSLASGSITLAISGIDESALTSIEKILKDKGVAS